MSVRRGRFPVTRAPFYLIRFGASAAIGEIDELIWVNGPTITAGEAPHKVEISKLEMSDRRMVKKANGRCFLEASSVG
jgi:hypothetical protein